MAAPSEKRLLSASTAGWAAAHWSSAGPRERAAVVINPSIIPTTGETMTDYLADVRKHAAQASEAHVNAIVKYCGIALRNTDSALVSGSDPKELATVRDGFAAKKLGLSAEAADAAIAGVVEKMKGVNRKSRVTFYYLLADATGTLSKLG
jgi:hypothetical protein